MRTKLEDKVNERLADLDENEALELLKLDIHDIVQKAIEAKLKGLTDDELLDLL